MSPAKRIVSTAWALCAMGCAGRFDPAHFEGSREALRAEPEAIQELAAATDLLEILGKVQAGCSAALGFRALNKDPLSDVACSSDRLIWTLKESAANAGGEALVGLRCSSRPGKGSRDARFVECAATVARFRAGKLASPGPLTPPRSVSAGLPAPSASDVKRIDEPDASLAFRIAVTFRPAVPTFRGRTRAGAEVQEVASLPLADQPLGDLSTSCDGACDERALRYGVLIAAGQLGVPDVVGVRCFETNAGQACVGTLAAPTLAE